IQYIVHSRHDQRANGGRLRDRRSPDYRPEIGLQFQRAGVDLLQPRRITRRVKHNTLADIVSEQYAYALSFGTGEQVRTNVFGADRVCFRLLVRLAQIVSADGHGKAEADDEA